MFVTRKLDVIRGNRALIRGLSMTIKPGRIVVVLGPNGAGKSSLLLALCGMLPVGSGDILLHDKPLHTFSRRQLAECIAWQGELPPTEFGLTVEQRLLLAATSPHAYGITKSRLAEVCASLDLTELKNRPLGVLSAGERQRVELAAILMRDCPLWLLDEPTAHLDLRHQSLWLDLMRKQAEQGRMIVAVLHDVQQAASIADEVVLVFGGGPTNHGSAADLLKPETLKEVFSAPLQILSGEHGQYVIAPAYGGGRHEGS